MEPLEAIERRLQRIERAVRALRAAYDRSIQEQKSLLLTHHKQRERLREQLLRLRQKVEVALSYGRGDSDMDDSRAASDDTGVPADNSAP